MRNEIMLALEIIGRFLVALGVGHSLDSLEKGLIFTIFAGVTLLFWTILPINRFAKRGQNE